MENSLADIELSTINNMEFNFEKNCIPEIKTQFVTGCIADAYYANQSIETILRIMMRDMNKSWIDNALPMRHFANIELRNALLKKVYWALAGKMIPDQVITSENGFYHRLQLLENTGKEDMEVYLIAMERLKHKQMNCYDALVKIASTVKQCDLTKFTTLLFLMEKQAFEELGTIMQAGVKSIKSDLYFSPLSWLNRLNEMQITILQN